jgi:hypothetical protein
MGYLIPEEAFIEAPRSGAFWVIVRRVGDAIIRTGAWFRSFGYAKKKIYPRRSLLEELDRLKIQKG